ncbi:conserved protein of unknown function (plasmid) [Pararobbsia alpina]|uniref:DUF6723 family protein n=1 Tax=Pararobbsia alpina TaxID=621374 RepID=UPI0039A53B45
MPRWNLFGNDASLGGPSEPATAENYVVVSGYTCVDSVRFFGMLKVTRKSDKRKLFPFDGAPLIGPFSTGYEAREAAADMGERIVGMDMVSPEP